MKILLNLKEIWIVKLWFSMPALHWRDKVIPTVALWPRSQQISSFSTNTYLFWILLHPFSTSSLSLSPLALVSANRQENGVLLGGLGRRRRLEIGSNWTRTILLVQTRATQELEEIQGMRTESGLMGFPGTFAQPWPWFRNSGRYRWMLLEVYS